MILTKIALIFMHCIAANAINENLTKTFAVTDIRNNISNVNDQIRIEEYGALMKQVTIDHFRSPYYNLLPSWIYLPKTEQIDNLTECSELSSIDEFPNDLFTKEQRQHGAFLLHVLGAIYFFTICGLVINNYFLPSIECFCDDLHITPDVAAAVFMATATAVPELSANTISIFIADSDMGIGTVIGSLMWNVLGVAALASLATSKPVRMNRIPITRDSIMFAFNSLIFYLCVADGKVYLWEASIMLLFVVFYYLVMFQNDRITNWTIKVLTKIKKRQLCSRPNKNDIEKQKQVVSPSKSEHPDKYDINENTCSHQSNDKDSMEKQESNDKIETNTPIRLTDPDQNMSLWPIPKNQSKLRTFFWYYSWPIRFVLTITVPNPNTWRPLYPITFILCIGWIGMVTYFIFWMMVVIAHTFNIPESVMGLTVFAIGGCTPEMITGFLMARRGNSGVGVAHSLGAASLAILISLGFPWFIRTIIQIKNGAEPFVNIHSNGMEYTVLSLIAVVASLYVCLSLTGFTLKKVTGIGLIICYLVFITLAVLIEVDVFFPNEDCKSSL